jgi:EAL domain-containing protein (putative c-di-GMP-specific phosphodiesterase class I)/CheY-like chemotaxis protein
MSGHDTAKPRLLVIDDEPGICGFVAEVAELCGYSASAITEHSGISAELDRGADVIVLDLQMPGMDGIEVVRDLARRGSRATVILSSGVDRRILDSAARLATGHGLKLAGRLQKPVRAAELKALLEGLLKREPQSPGRAGVPYQPGVEEIRLAIDRDELIVHCQPQVSLEDGRWVGVEALARWQHPIHGLMFPDQFVGSAEQNCLGLALTYRVLEHALRQCAAFQQAAGFSGMLSVNVPAIALYDVTFPEQVVARVEQAGGWPHVTFEVTETSVSAELTAALDVLTRLRMKGFGLSIDDFGTGSSGLQRLHQLPFTELKIDMQFVRAAETDAAAKSIVESSIALAKDLGMAVVAEGVENESIWHWLRRRECHVAQGYFVSKPASAEQLAVWAATWRMPQ